MSATTVDELQVLISANASQFQQEIKKVQAQMGEMNQSMKSSTSGMRGLSVAGVAMGTMIGAAISKVAGILSSQLNPAISRLDTLNNFPRVMANLGVSSSLSEKSIAVLSEKLKGLPTTLDDAAMSVQRFTSANGSIGASTQMFLALNNAILAGGGSADIQKTALEQLSQAYAKGKPDMMEWRSLMTAMPAQLKQIAQSMNYASSADLGEALREGKLSMNEFMAQIVKLNREGFGGFASFEEQARNSTGGVATSLANLRNAVVRAITDVMNIVGQANISGFFQSIANAINAAVPYVAAFVKVVMMAIGALRTLFGGGGKSSPQKATAEISNNLGSAGSNAGNLADSAGGAGKKLGGAAKQAKKLAEQLAGFDEMNVLKTPEEPSGGGGGGSGGGGGGGGGISGTLPDFGEIDTSGLDSVAKKAEEIANSIKKFFEGIFDFEKIGTAMKLFWADLKAGAESITSILGDVWKNYLKPVISWTGNSLLPAVLNAIGGAIRFIGAIIKDYYHTFLKPFLDNFLTPLARWTGGIIVDILNKLGNSLRSLSQNEKAVRAFSTALHILLTTLTINKIASGILTAKTAITAFSGELTKAIGIFSRATKSGLSLSSSFGAVAGQMGGAIGQIAGGFQGLTGILPMVKGAFSGLFAMISAHPLVAIAVAIAGLILSNKELRDSVFGLIGEALKPFGELLSDIMNALSPLIQAFQPLLKILTNLLEIALKPTIMIWTAMAKILTPIISAIVKLGTVFSPLGTALKVLQPIFNAINQGLEDFSKWLDQMMDEIDKLLDTLPDWAKDLLGIKKSSDEASKSTASLKKENKDLNSTLEDVLESEKKLKDSRAGLAGTAASLIKSTQDINATFAEFGMKADFSQEKLAELGLALTNYATPAEQAKFLNQELSLSLDANNAAHLEQIQAISDLGVKQDEYNTKLNTASLSQNKLTKALQDTRFSSQNVRDSFAEVISKFQSGELNAGKLTAKISELRKKGDEDSKELKDAIIRHADAFGLKWDETQQKMVQASTKAKSDISRLEEEKSSKISKEMSNAERAATSAFNSIGRASNSAGEKTKSAFSGRGEEIGKEAGTAHRGISDNFGKFGQIGAAASTSLKSPFQGFNKDFQTIANYALTGLRIGGGPIGQIAATWAQGLMGTFKRVLGIHSPSRVFRGFGGFVGEGFALGVEDEQNSIGKALENMTAGFKPEIPPFELAEMPKLSNDLPDISRISGSFEQKIEASISDKIEKLNEKPINLTVNVGNEKMLEQLIDGINNRSFMNNASVIDF